MVAAQSSVQAFLSPQVSERTDVGQSEGEAEKIFIAHIGNGVAAVLEGNAATIPVISGLAAGELQLPEFGIKANAASRTESPARKAAVTQRNAKLLKLARDLAGVRSGPALAFAQAWRRCIGLRNLQKGMSATESEGAEIVVHQQRAGIDPAQLEVVVHIPFCVGMAAGIDAQARNERGQMARLGDECNASQV